MKRINLILLTMVLVLSMFLPVMAAKEITLKVNGEICKTDVAPVIHNDRTLIPARAVFEELGATVSWNEKSQCVSIRFKEDEIILYIGHATALVNSSVKQLDVPAKIIDDRTMIPVRFVGETLGMKIGWDEATYTVSVDYVEEEEKEEEVLPEEPEIPVKPTNSLSMVTITDDEEASTVELSGVGGVKPSVMKLSNPSRLVLDFEDTEITCEETAFESENPNVKAVRLGQFEADVARVVVDLKEFVDYDITNEEECLILSLVNETGELGKEDDKDSEKDGYISSVKLSKNAKDKLVFIDPGHGGTEVGTIGKQNGKDIYEKNINIKIARLVNEMLVNNGVKTYMLRKADETYAVTKRPEIANKMGAHFYLSLHNNASENEDVKGVQICYSSATAKYSSMTNRKIAETFYNNIASLGLRKAGLLNNSRYIVIYKADMPSIIVESAFMSNEDDLKLLTNDKFLEKLAQKICDSTIEILNKSANAKIVNESAKAASVSEMLKTEITTTEQ